MTSSTSVIVITGASRGIGLATLKHLLSLPAPPQILTISRSSSPLKDKPDNVIHLTADLGSKSYTSVAKQICETCIKTWGRIDGLLLNHGTIGPVARVVDANLVDWEECFVTNYFSGVAVVKECLTELRKTNGRVVLVSSGAAGTGYIGWGAYGSSKAAMNHFALTLAAEEKDITAVAIRPGVVDTNMQEVIREQHKEVMGEHHAKFITIKESGKMVKPEDVAVVLGNLTLKAGRELNGKFLSWDDASLSEYKS